MAPPWTCACGPNGGDGDLARWDPRGGRCVRADRPAPYPDDRIEHMLGEAEVAWLLDDHDVDGAEVRAQSAERVEIVANPDDLAYIMYTSGSTGWLKGVAVRHSSAVEYAETLGREVVSPPKTSTSRPHRSRFPEIRQMLVPFRHRGAGGHRDDGGAGRDPARSCVESVSHRSPWPISSPPWCSPWRRGRGGGAAPDANCSIAAGRAAAVVAHRERTAAGGVVRGWREQLGFGARWINMYGQTETTGFVGLHPVGEPDANDQSIVPIGRPRANVGMYVLDRLMRPVPAGVAGALYIAGDALAREYVGDPALTAQ